MMLRHNSPISGVAAYQDRYVATAGYDNQVILWNALNQTPLQRGFHDHLANQCRFSPCGRYLVSAGSDYTARLWRLPDLKLISVFADHDDDVEMAVFHPHRPLVATASRDDHVRIFELDGNKCRDFEGHASDVISVEWSQDGNFLISSGDDGTIRRWNLQKGIQEEIIDLEGVETDTLAFTREGVLYAGNDEGEIVIVRGPIKKFFKAHQSGVKRLVYDANRRALLSLSYDRTANIYDCAFPEAPALKHTTQLPAVVWPRSAAFLGKDRLVFGSFGTSYAIYNLHSKKWDLRAIQDTRGHNAVLAQDGNLYTVGDAGIVRKNDKVVCRIGTLCNFLLAFDKIVLTGGQMGIVYNALTGEAIYQHQSPLNCGTVFKKDGKPWCMIGTYTGDGLLFKTDAEGKVRFAGSIRLHPNAVKGLCANERFIFSVCATGAAAFHALDDFQTVRYLNEAHDKISNGCASLNGRGFASVSRDLKLRLWKEDGTCQTVSTPHTHSIKCVQASPDGKRIATGAYDGQVAVYDLNKKSWSKIRRPTTSGISYLTASPTQQGFWASSYDGEVYKI